MYRIFFFIFVVAMSVLPRGLRADDATADTDSRLRQALRDMKTQVISSQDQVIELQAAKDQAEKDAADLKAKVDALSAQIAELTKQNADDKAASDKAAADLNAQLAEQISQIERLNQAVAEWKSATDQANKLAAEKEALRANAVLQSALLQRTIDDRETRNLELYKTASEILVRYEKFSLGEALEAKEPFAGTARTKLESLVQDYKVKLLDQTVHSGQPLDLANANSFSTLKPGNQTGQGLPSLEKK